jgi:hypothetical protein
LAEVHAVAVEGVRSQLTADGKMGLLYFQRMKPDAKGARDLNVAVPVALLPYVAVSAMEAIAQSGDAGPGAPAFIMQAKTSNVVLSREGLMVLTLELEMGAKINFSNDPHPAETLQRAMSVAVGRQKAQALRAQATARRGE